MENTLVTLPKQTAINIFTELATYPIPKDVIRYIKTTDTTIQPVFHDLISQNLTALVPNLNIGMQMNMTTDQLMDWIQKTKEYGELLVTEFQKQCENRLNKLIKIEESKERAKALDMRKLDRLPEDIIRYIHEYLFPETRRVLLLARYPNLYNNVIKLKTPVLKKLMERIRTTCYYPMMNGLFRNNRTRCLPVGFYLTFGFSNKKGFIDCIDKFIGTCIGAVPYTESDYRYFQKKALRILNKLVYVAKRNNVLDKPYAPELEPPNPVKKEKKPRAKKQKPSES
jgi:hypothetical protein